MATEQCLFRILQETRIPDKDVQVVPEKSANKKSSAKRRQAWPDAGVADRSLLPLAAQSNGAL